MPSRPRKRAQSQQTWTVPPLGAFSTRTRGLDGVHLSSEREVRLGCRGGGGCNCSPERSTPAKVDGRGGFISPSTPCSRAETHHWGGFGHYSNTDALLLYLSCTATAGSVTLTASYPASFFPAEEVPRQHQGLWSKHQRRLLMLRPRPKRQCRKYQRYLPW